MERHEVEIGREVVFNLSETEDELELGVIMGWFTKDMVNVRFESHPEDIPTRISALEYPSIPMLKFLRAKAAQKRLATEEPKGLFIKYHVTKADTGEGVDGCFVLRPDRDPAALHALLAYADYCDSVQGKSELAADLRKWAMATKVLSQ